MKNKVTLAALSRETGLSPTTISMILSKRSDVSFSEETIKIVQKAAKDMGYVPGTRKSATIFNNRAIMVVCPYLINHYYSAAVQSIQSAATDLQCNVLVFTTYNNEDEEAKILTALAESDIGGIIFTMMPQSKNLLRRISKMLPIVIISDKDGNIPLDFIEMHNYKAGELIASHLAELGHKHIICVSTPLSDALPMRKKRYEGIRDAWAKLCPEGSVKIFTSFTSPAMARNNIQLERYLGQEITLSALEQIPDEVTAIVGLNDMLAYGVMDALAMKNKKIPQDFSVCGCDNDFPSDIAGVSLTSVEHFMAQNAKEAFKLLYGKITENQGTAQLKVIQPELVKRGSTAAPTR